MKMKNIKLHQILIGMLLILNLSACTDDDSGNMNEVKVYIPAIGSSYNVIKGNVLTLRDEMIAGNDLKFPVLLTRPYSKDVQVTAWIDTTLISVYDSIYNASSPRFPEGFFSLSNNTVTIKAGQTTSGDSISLAVNPEILAAKSSYVIPVVISTVNSGVPISSNRNVMYVNTNFAKVNSSLGALSLSNGTIKSDIIYTPGGVDGPDKLKFPGYLSQPIPKPAEITIGLPGNSAVDDYNRRYRTNYLPFPEGAYSLVNNKATVPVDAFESRDSFEVKISNKSAFQKDLSYLLVLRIEDEGIVEPRLSAQEMYLIVNAGFSNFNLSNTSEPDELLNRNGWSVADYGSQSYGDARNVLDDNYNTSWMTSVRTANITLDMGAMQTLKGIQLSPNYKYAVSYNISIFEIATSEDNVTWTTQGNYSGKPFTGSVSSPEKRNIHFYSPVQARYFKITYGGGATSGFAGASEIKVF